MMKKTIPSDGWDFHGEPSVMLLKLASDGRFCGPVDKGLFVKRASEAFLPVLGQVKFAVDEEPLHVIAVGATEKWGANRNGDGFLEKTCRDWLHTFVKHAHWYRNHDHGNPAKSYGIVKWAGFNPVMHRIELLVALNKSAAAAERNGGGKIAERELRMIHEGKPIASSMSCKIAYDICAWCGNKARTKASYCTEETCKAGGCKNNLGKYVKVAGDVFHLHVENPNPLFHDISDVSDTRPADRTAYASGAEWLKAAADQSAAAFAGGLLAFTPGEEAPEGASPRERLALKLAAAAAGRTGLPASVLPSFGPRFKVAEVLGHLPRHVKVAEALSLLAQRGAVLPIASYAALLQDQPTAETIKAAAAVLPSAYATVAAEGEDALCSYEAAPTAMRCTKQAEDAIDRAFGLTPAGVAARNAVAEARGLESPTLLPLAKSASDEAARLALDYAAYSVSALALCEGRPHFALTASLAAAQNRFC